MGGSPMWREKIMGEPPMPRKITMNPLSENRRHITRRALLGRTATGIGTAALAYLFQNDLFAATSATTQATTQSIIPSTQPLATAIGALPGLPHFAPKAKRVIYMFQNGAPS